MQTLSPEAQHIFDAKEPGWEYRLTLVLLQTGMRPTIQRWEALRRSLYSKPTTRVTRRDTIGWLQDRLAEMTNLTASFTGLVNGEFARAWGEPGQPGDADMIASAAELFSEMCAGALAWEERVRFAAVDNIFEPVRELFVGVAGAFIDESQKLPDFISSVMGEADPSGTKSLHMVLDTPPGWADDVDRALKAAAAEYVANPNG